MVSRSPERSADIVVRSSIAGQFDELSGHDHPDLQTEYFTASLADLQAAGEGWYARTGSEYANTGDCGTGYCASTDWTTDLRTTEETTAAYLQYNWTGDIGDMPANLRLGVRYEETEVTSAALNTLYDGSSWVGAGNELNITEAVDEDGNVLQGFTNVTGDYDVTLPNFDFDIEPWEDVFCECRSAKPSPVPVIRTSRVAYRLTAPSSSPIRGRRHLPATRGSCQFNRSILIYRLSGTTRLAATCLWVISRRM